MPDDVPVGAAPLREAATVVLMRDGTAGAAPGEPDVGEPEVLLLRRRSGDGFAAGAWVFPGGTVDADDRALPAERRRGLDVAAAAARLRLPPDATVGAHVAGVRETFEEAGILLAGEEDGGPADPRSAACRRLRAELADRGRPRPLGELLAAAGLVLDLGALVPFARWMTPRTEPRRFDAVFFCARAPADQVARHDADETVEQRWLAPREALSAHRRGELPMIHPTIKTMEWLAGFGGVADTLAGAAAAPVEPILPHVEWREGRLRLLHPGDAGYPTELRAEMEART